MTDAGHGVHQNKLPRRAPGEADAGRPQSSALLARFGLTAFAAMLAEAATFPIGAPRVQNTRSRQSLTGGEHRHDEDAYAARGASRRLFPDFSTH